jgi:hypothetical protein
VLPALVVAASLLLPGCGPISQNLLNAAVNPSGRHKAYPNPRRAVRAARYYCGEDQYPVVSLRLVLDIEELRGEDPALVEALGPERRELHGMFGEPRAFYWAAFRQVQEDPLPQACQVFMDGKSLRAWSVIRPRAAPVE